MGLNFETYYIFKHLFIYRDSTIRVDLFDLKGSLVKTTRIFSAEKIEINISDLNKGVYIIRISSEGVEMKSEKVLIN